MTPFTWNADREILTPTQFRSVIGGGWRNYIKRGYVWQPISALIAGDLSCTTFPGNVQFAADSQGWSDIVIDGTFSMQRHIAERNGHNAEPELRLSMQVECDHNVAGHIDTLDPDPDKWRPWQVVYPGAWDCADLRLGIWQGKAARIEKVIDFHSLPDGDSEFIEHSFLIRSSHARVLAGPSLDVSPWQNGYAELFDSQAFVARADSQLRGVLLKTPVAWYYTADGTEVRIPIRVTFEIQDDGETVRCTKHIPRVLIATALSHGSHLKADATFSPDASPETSTCDGMARGSASGTWETLLGVAGNYSTDNESTTDLMVESLSGSGLFGQFRHLFFGFDTSSIGSGQQIDATTCRWKFDRQSVSGHDLNVHTQIYEGLPASNTAIANGDYMSVGVAPYTDTPRHLFSESYDPTFVTYTYNQTGRDAINTTGITNTALSLVEAQEGGSPTWAASKTDSLQVYMAESTGTTNDPLLTVTHSAASSFGAWYTAANPSGY